MAIRPVLALALALACVSYIDHSVAQSVLLSPGAAYAPSPAVGGPVTVSGNTTGSLGNLCSSETGIQTALQSVTSNQDTAGLNVSIPAELTSTASLQQVAQVNSFALLIFSEGPSFIYQLVARADLSYACSHPMLTLVLS